MMEMEEAMEKQKTHFEALEAGAEPIEISGSTQTEGNIEALKRFLWDPENMKKKIRVVIDHDPDFPLMDVQVFELHQRS